jgi:tRNA threonylcarbamoyladenosine modification (KEOPS) complex  Pcc1 subunit
LENTLDLIKGEIIVTDPNYSLLKALYASLSPETLSIVDRKRGKVEVKVYREGRAGKLVIKIESKTMGGFRSLFNAYVYLLKTAIEVIRQKE